MCGTDFSGGIADCGLIVANERDSSTAHVCHVKTTPVPIIIITSYNTRRRRRASSVAK